jgi:hypothetical protein
MTEPIKLPPIPHEWSMCLGEWSSPVYDHTAMHDYARLAVEQATAELREQLTAMTKRAEAAEVVLLESRKLGEELFADFEKAAAERDDLRADAERWKFVRRHSWKELQRVRVLAGIKVDSVLGPNWQDAVDDLLEAAGTTEQAIAARAEKAEAERDEARAELARLTTLRPYDTCTGNTPALYWAWDDNEWVCDPLLQRPTHWTPIPPVKEADK